MPGHPGRYLPALSPHTGRHNRGRLRLLAAEPARGRLLALACAGVVPAVVHAIGMRRRPAACGPARGLSLAAAAPQFCRAPSSSRPDYRPCHRHRRVRRNACAGATPLRVQPPCRPARRHALHPERLFHRAPSGGPSQLPALRPGACSGRLPAWPALRQACGSLARRRRRPAGRRLSPIRQRGPPAASPVQPGGSGRPARRVRPRPASTRLLAGPGRLGPGRRPLRRQARRHRRADEPPHPRRLPPARLPRLRQRRHHGPARPLLGPQRRHVRQHGQLRPRFRSARGRS